jgi:hypothetical protein
MEMMNMSGVENITKTAEQWLPTLQQIGPRLNYYRKEVESWIKDRPGLAMGTAFFLGAIVGWQRKR